MKLELIAANPLEHTTPALVMGCWEDNQHDLFARCDAALGGLLSRLSDNREFSGKANSTHLLHTLGRLPAERLLLVGLGKQAELNDERIRQASGTAVQVLRAARIPFFSTVLHLARKESTAIEAVDRKSVV